MPYIPRNRRGAGIYYEAANSGELNYVFTYAICEYIRLHPGYQGINDVLGALEGAKLEFYRRVVVPYETQKIEENGDVYE